MKIRDKRALRRPADGTPPPKCYRIANPSCCEELGTVPVVGPRGNAQRLLAAGDSLTFAEPVRKVKVDGANELHWPVRRMIGLSGDDQALTSIATPGRAPIGRQAPSTRDPPMYGELVPLGGGDPIPLLKKKLLIGRRESCDIVLRFANVSAHHCELWIEGGYLYVRDLQSRNGVKINGIRNPEGRLDPGDTLSVAKHSYRVDYSPADLGAVGPPPTENRTKEIMSTSLLARAGLQKTDFRGGSDRTKRFDPTNNNAGQIKLPGDKL